MTAVIPPIISADDHVVEPPHLWKTWLPDKYRDAGPHVELLPFGTKRFDRTIGRFVESPGTDGPPVSYWVYEGVYSSLKRLFAAAGFSGVVDDTPIVFDDVRPGCYDPKARLADMDLNGIEASLCFPNYPRFAGQIFHEAQDKALALACVRAYNDWMVEEWCGDSDGRLLPLCLVPLWDPALAAAEVRRNAARGVRVAVFSEVPAWLGLPSIHSGEWDPFFRACAETGTVVCMHIGSGSRSMITSEDAPHAVRSVMIYANSSASMLDFLTSGVMARFPNLKLMYAEAQIGWVPYVIARADDLWRQQPWNFEGRVPEPPSTYYYDRIYSCFFRDAVGIELLDRLGRDQVLYETDYPHQDGTFPHSPKIAAELFGHLPQETVDKLARGNSAKLFGL